MKERDWLLQCLHNAKNIRVDQTDRLDLIPQRFSDSSCQLWQWSRSSGEHRKRFIKLADKQQASVFWEAMRLLYDVDIETVFQNAEKVNAWVQAHSRLSLPQVLHQTCNERRCMQVLTEVQGKAVVQDELDQNLVLDLATWLVDMHRVDLSSSGSIVSIAASHGMDAKAVSHWRAKLKGCFQFLLKNHADGLDVGFDWASRIDELEVSLFTVVMMDLRWDQFAQLNQRLVGVFDCDAFVAAPIELDFVILEYLLTKTQLVDFERHYRNQGGSIPNLKKVRVVYRALLFLMNVLGERDYSRWMSHPKFFA